MSTVSPPRLVCILGAESTGKTTLTQNLAEHFNVPWVPEYLRQFSLAHSRPPLQHEQRHIIRQQLALENAALERAQQYAAPYVFCDTAPLLTAVYSEIVFADVSLYDSTLALHARYALTLLLENDVRWEPDQFLRDGDHVREPVRQRLRDYLEHKHYKTASISGLQENRLTAALAALSPLSHMTE